MSMVAWSFLDLHPSYSGWTKPRRAVSVTQGRDALEELGEGGSTSHADAGHDLLREVEDLPEAVLEDELTD